MGGDESPDKVIREREFRLPSGIDIGNLDVSENVNDSKSTDVLANVYKNKQTKSEESEYEECLSCQ